MRKIFYKGNLYQSDVVTIKKYGEKLYKVTLHRKLRQNGFEIENGKKLNNVNDEKLECNISRARAKIFEYAYCNDWSYFVNLTLDKKKYDRYNLKKYVSDLTQWLRNYGRKTQTKVKYLFIPEQHKDGAWHIHGLIEGLPMEYLSEFIPGLHPQKLITAGYLNWRDYEKKFGYVSVAPLKNKEAVSKYLTKYITKDMANNNTELGERLYYCSKGLKVAEEIKRGFMLADMNPDYENDYVKIKWVESEEIAFSLIS